MGVSYTQFSTSERFRIEEMRLNKKSYGFIGEMLGRSKSSIWYETRKCTSTYSARSAQEYTEYIREKAAISRWKLGDIHADFLRQKLTSFMTVESLVGRLNLENKRNKLPTSIATIYRFIDHDSSLKVLLPHKKRFAWGTKKQDARTRVFEGAKPVKEHPEDVRNRTQVGHREIDLLCGPRFSSGTAVLTSNDRTSRYLTANKLPHGKDADELEKVIIRSHKKMQVLSMTCDRGLEFARWRAIGEKLNCDFYVAEPHSPWEKPTVEWGNGVLRRVFPKGTDFGKVKEYRLAKTVREFNHTPRKCLGYKTPHEVQYGKDLFYFK